MKIEDLPSWRPPEQQVRRGEIKERFGRKFRSFYSGFIKRKSHVGPARSADCPLRTLGLSMAETAAGSEGGEDENKMKIGLQSPSMGTLNMEQIWDNSDQSGPTGSILSKYLCCVPVTGRLAFSKYVSTVIQDPPIFHLCSLFTAQYRGIRDGQLLSDHRTGQLTDIVSTTEKGIVDTQR